MKKKITDDKLKVTMDDTHITQRSETDNNKRIRNWN